MGKKKQREGEANPTSGGDVFNTIFGDAHDQLSIFSDTNPFRRKPIEPETPKTADSQTHDVAELKKLIRSKAKRSGLDSYSSDDDAQMETRKPKKERTQEPKLDSDVEPDTTMPMKKKKRKRDELETKYEVNKYGAVAEAKMEGGEVARVGEKRKKVDEPAEMLTPKEGFDDETKLLRTVFVGNLPLKVKKKGLLKEFSQFGEVESVRLRSIPLLDSKTPRTGAIRKKQINDAVDSVHAYIVFKTEESAQASLAHNMAVVEGNHIRVDRACPPRKKLRGDQTAIYDNKRTVFVGNLPFDVKDEEVYQLFCGISNLESSVEAVRVVRDPHSSLGKGIAYVLFKTRDAAHMVVKKRNLKLRDRDLRLSHAKSDSTPSKRSSTSSPASTSNVPSKKFRAVSRTPSDKVDTRAPLAYQGLRASKSGVQKKSYTKSFDSGKSSFKTQKGEKPKERKGKRPSVAARKAKILNDGTAPPTQAGKKRKMESRSPRSSQRNKKMNKFK